MPLTSTTLDQLRSVCGPKEVLTMKEDLIPYSFDGTAALQQLPGCVVFVQNAEQIRGVLRLANETKTAVVTRGSGTGLSGGSLPSADCIVLCTVKMNRLNTPKAVNVRGRVINEQAEFACPCHGSKYYGDGTNYAGPAPRPLAHFKLEIAPEDGQLVVDTSQTVPQDFRLTV